MRTYKNCPPFLESYLRYLELVENRAASTLEGKCHDIRDFLKFLRRREEGVPTPEEIAANDIFVAGISADIVAAVTEDDVEEYLEHLALERHVSQHTIYFRKTVSLRDFYDWMLKQQVDLGVVILTNPVPHYDSRRAAAPAKPTRVLTHAELDKVLKAVDGDSAIRDVAMILLVATTGLAATELAKVKHRDYHGDHLVYRGRKIFLTEAAQKALRVYLAEYRDPIEDFLKDNTLFVSRLKKKRLSPRGIQNALQKHFDRAGVEGSARDLRYTAVVELLKNARNECERAHLAGYLGYTDPASISRLPLPKAEDTGEQFHAALENSWLNDLGKRN